MIITNNSESQSLKIIPRESSLTYTGSSPKQLSANALSIVLTEEGSNLTQSVFNLLSYRYDNCLTLNFNQINSFFREGFYYLITISTNNEENNLVYRDKISIVNSSDVPYDDKTRYSINESQYIILQEGDGSNVYNEGGSDYESTGGGYVPNDSSTGQVNPNDTNNDGYGETYSVNNSIINKNTNIYGEWTVDFTEFGTFQTADNYYAISVEDFYIGQPSAMINQPSYNSNGLADGLNGYVRYRSGYDERIADVGYIQFAADMLTNEGVTVRSLEPSSEVERATETVYIANNNNTINVGDSVYSDANGTQLEEGTTNGRANRYWFLHKDNNNDYMVCKVTGGVVTHYYEWRSSREGNVKYGPTDIWKKQDVLSGPVTTQTMLKEGNTWEGNGPTHPTNPGGYVVHNTFAEVITDAQSNLNNGYSASSNNSLSTDDDATWLNYNGDDTPYDTGKYLYRYNDENERTSSYN